MEEDRVKDMNRNKWQILGTILSREKWRKGTKESRERRNYGRKKR
jgi:hypothetical protein